MSATISGSYKKILRVETGFYSMDRACLDDEGHLGLPIGTGYEIFGSPGVGKSTFAQSLSAVLGRLLGMNIVMAALEDFDSRLSMRLLEFARFNGNLHITDKKDDEDNLNEVVDFLYKKDYAIGIVDSLGAISPIAEQKGDIGESFMGRRATVVAQFTRKSMPLLRPDESVKTIFMLNHWYPKIGSRGYDTPAGEVKKYITTIRILLKRAETFVDGSYWLQGHVYKNRWGFNGRDFNVFVLVGRGLHPGLSLVMDGVVMKKFSRAKQTYMISIGDEKIGRLPDLVKAAKNGDNTVFEPFYAALSGVKEPEPTEENVDGHTEENIEFMSE